MMSSGPVVEVQPLAVGYVPHRAPPRFAIIRCGSNPARRRIAAGRLHDITVGATGVANRILRGSALPIGWSTAAIVLAVTCAVDITPAMAAIDLSAGATIGVEHDSNPLEISDSQAQDFLAKGFISSFGDIAKRLTANVAAKNGVDGPTHLQLQALATRVDYDSYTSLDHTEYSVNGNLDWKPGQVFDVSLQAYQTLAPVSQNDVGGVRVVQQTTSEAEGTLRLRPTPRWQVSLTPRWFSTDTPLPGGVSDFQLRESGGSVALDYLGVGRLVPGLVVQQLEGDYAGVEFPTRYQQRSVEVSLKYKVTDFSNFSLYAGRAERTTHLIEPTNNAYALSLEGTTKGFTGSLDYLRQLTAKTHITVGVFHEFRPYDVGVNTTVGTGFNVSVNWATTAKFSVKLDADIVRSIISDAQVAASFGDREDLERSYSLGVKYLATRRVSLRSYVTRHIQNSTVRSAVFDRTIAGLELTATID
jgi:hypothetical protein